MCIPGCQLEVQQWLCRRYRTRPKEEIQSRKEIAGNGEYTRENER